MILYDPIVFQHGGPGQGQHKSGAFNADIRNVVKTKLYILNQEQTLHTNENFVFF